jgi:hypothetical protein
VWAGSCKIGIGSRRPDTGDRCFRIVCSASNTLPCPALPCPGDFLLCLSLGRAGCGLRMYVVYSLCRPCVYACTYLCGWVCVCVCVFYVVVLFPNRPTLFLFPKPTPAAPRPATPRACRPPYPLLFLLDPILHARRSRPMIGNPSLDVIRCTCTHSWGRAWVDGVTAPSLLLLDSPMPATSGLHSLSSSPCLLSRLLSAVS